MDKHLAIFYGGIYRKEYRFDSYQYYDLYRKYGYPAYFSPELYEKHIKIKDQEIYRFEIDNPPMEINEKVYIEEINKTVQVLERVRNAQGGYIYFTDYEIEVNEDDETLKSKEIAEERQKEYNEKKNETSVIEDKKTIKKWYQFWK